MVANLGKRPQLTGSKAQLALEAIVQATAASGDDYFATIAQHIAERTAAKYVFIGRIADDALSRIETLAFILDGKISKNFAYETAGTPCQTVLGQHIRYYGENVAEVFPDDQDLRDMNAKCYLGVPLFDAAGMPNGIIAILDDTESEELLDERSFLLALAKPTGIEIERQKLITELSIAKESAERATELKNQFLANMSHEVRSPMTAILGFLEMIQSAHLGTSTRKKYMGLIRKNCLSLLRILDDILDISRIESNNISFHDSRFSPTELIREIHEEKSLAAAAKNLSLNLQVHPSTPTQLYSDRVRLKQILSNLVDNAIKYTDEGHVDLGIRSCESQIGRIEISVSDTGIGIDSFTQAQIFEPFVAGNLASSGQVTGSGLGLSICKRLAEGLKGDLSFDSTPGSGSTFRITLPIHKNSPAELAKDSHLESKKRSNLPYKILLAEDNDDIQMLLRELLESMGSKVECADNGKACVDMVAEALERNDPYDAILMDVQMPIMTGYRAVEILRNRNHREPIIALTAFAMNDDRQRCMSAGFDDYIPKPVDSSVLASTLKRHIH